jgi:tetratricopeptide (TPR) repeat protein
LYKRGQYEEAIKDYDIAIILHDTYGTALYNRGLAKYRLGKSIDACKDLKSAQLTGFEVPLKVINKICGIQ